MGNFPEMANPGPVPDEVIESMIEVASAHAAGQPTSNAEAVFLLFATPAVLQELLDRRRAMAGVAWLNKPGNVVALKLVKQNGGAA